MRQPESVYLPEEKERKEGNGITAWEWDKLSFAVWLSNGDQYIKKSGIDCPAWCPLGAEDPTAIRNKIRTFEKRRDGYSAVYLRRIAQDWFPTQWDYDRSGEDEMRADKKKKKCKKKKRNEEKEKTKMTV